jgi:hypothetical protein
MTEDPRPKKTKTKVVTTFRGCGPMTAFDFVSAEKRKKYGLGSAVLVAPGKGREASGVVAIAIPPITVAHTASKDEWSVKVDFYLGVYNEYNRFTLPSNPDKIYPNQPDPTPLFIEMAQIILGKMLSRGMPLSKRFKELCPPEYGSDESQLTEEEEEEEEEEESAGD